MRTVLLTAAVTTISGAWSTARAEVLERTKLKGNQAVTFFAGTATIDCGDGRTEQFFADGFIDASQTITKTKGSPKTFSNGVFISASFFNGCTGESRFLSGGIPDGFDAPARNLRRAGIEGSTLLQDFGDGAQFPFELDVEIEGVGEVSSGKFKDRTVTQSTPDGPITMTISHFANANREGVATGTISIAGVEIVPEFSSTIMLFNANSQIIIER